uniref:Uncharacterized protein n=1 Tax=Arundo donax TaxID=35708 RepID=A0A0A9BEX6_ARUDO
MDSWSGTPLPVVCGAGPRESGVRGKP